MNPTETLKTEHRLIVNTLAALEKYVARVAAGTAEPRDLGRFVDFFREFVDACHHGKEEGILFAAMAESGFPTSGGPIAMMLQEHEEGRALARTLGELASRQAAWTSDDRGRIAEVARRYVELLGLHIEKENNILFPMADARVPATVMKQVGDRFEKFEEEETGRREHERFHELAEELIGKYAPGPRGVPACEHCQ